MAQKAAAGEEPAEVDEGEAGEGGDDAGDEAPREAPAPAGHVEGDAEAVKSKMGPHGAAAGSQRRVSAEVGLTRATGLVNPELGFTVVN
ncbi:MAG: hypothetical protein Q4G64_03330 [bacterium]|nr:hypothetical protein [bacterium]